MATRAAVILPPSTTGVDGGVDTPPARADDAGMTTRDAGERTVTCSSTGVLYGKVATSTGFAAFEAWKNPDAALEPDDASAEVALRYAGINSADLVVRDFGISVPEGAQISGIRVTVTRSAFPDRSIKDRLRLDLAKRSSPLRDGPAVWTSTKESAKYGGEADTFGVAITPADLASSAFSVALSAATENINGGTAKVDAVGVEVFYCQ